MVWATESPCVHCTEPYLPELSNPFCDLGAATCQHGIDRSVKDLVLTTVQVNHNLQSSAACPIEGLAELVVCSLHVGLAIDRNDAPVPNWDTHMVQSCLRHLVEVVLCDPRIPVLLQARLCGIFAQDLGIGPLIYRCIALEDAGCDPGLEDEPATCVDATDFLAIVVEEW